MIYHLMVLNYPLYKHTSICKKYAKFYFTVHLMDFHSIDLYILSLHITF